MTSSTIEALRAESPDAAQLAVYASLAARVDRALLRALRLELLPDADASIESDLWFADVVQRRGSADLDLATDVLGALRDELVASGQLDRARAIVTRVHAAPPPLLALEEELVYLGLQRASSEAIEERLGAAVASLRDQTQRALDIGSWALRALPRLPAPVQASTAAWSLALGAEAATGYAVMLADAPATMGGLAAALKDGPSATLTVHRSDGVLELRDEPAAVGAAMTVPATTPRIVEIEGVDERFVVAVPPGGRARIDVRDREPVVGNLLGQRWAVSARESDGVRATPTTVRYVVLPSIESDRQREREIFDRILSLASDLRRSSFEPDLVFAVGDLTYRRYSPAIAGEALWSEVVERLRRHLVGVFPRARVFLVPGAGDFRIPGTEGRALTASRIERGESVVLDGPGHEVFDRGNVQRGPLPGDLSVSLEIDGASIGVAALNSALADGAISPSSRQLAAICGDRVDWARRHALTFLVTDAAPQLYAPGVARDVQEAADLVVAARRAAEPELRFFARGNERCGYRRGTVTVAGDGITLHQELRTWGRAGYTAERGAAAVEEALTRRHRPAGPHARLVRSVVDRLAAGQRVVVTAPPGFDRAALVDEIRARRGPGVDPTLPSEDDDAGDVEAIRAASPGPALASQPLLPYAAEAMRATMNAEVFVASDLDAIDVADQCTGIADAGAVMRGSRGHPGVVRALLDELRSNPSLAIEDRGAELRDAWWSGRPLVIRSLPALEELDRCRRRGWAVCPVLRRSYIDDAAIWHLLAAGVLRRRGDGDALHWLPPPWLDGAWVASARDGLARHVPSTRLVEVETRVEDASDPDVHDAAVAVGHAIAATGWLPAAASSSPLLEVVARAAREVRSAPTTTTRPADAETTIVIGGRQDRRDDALHLPVVSVPQTVRLVQRHLLGLDRIRVADDIVNELGASAGIGVIVDEVSRIARNRLTGAEIVLRSDEAPLLLFGAGAVAVRRSARTKR